MRKVLSTSAYSSILLHLLFFSFIILFISLGTNFKFHITSIVTGALSFVVLFFWWVTYRLPAPRILLFPFIFLFFVVVTPGNFFIDARIAVRLACGLLSGVALTFFFEQLSIKFIAISVVMLVVSVICYAIFISITEFSFPERLAMHLGNPQLLGYVTAFAIVTIVAFFESAPWKNKKISYPILFILLLTALLTVSRSTYLGLIVFCIGYLGLYKKKISLRIVIAVIVALALTYPMLSHTQQSRIVKAATVPLTDITVKIRMGIWKSALDGFFDAPLVGNGVRSFTDYDCNYRKTHNKELSSSPYILTDTTSRWAHPHSLLLTTLYGWGVVGTILFVLSFVPAFAYTDWQKDKYFILSLLFTFGFSFADVYIKSNMGAFYMFFPLGMTYGSYLNKLYSSHDGRPFTPLLLTYKI
ncbi:MAG: O-antigen ligase family protein [Desulfovibrionales bacterium]|nr:O-antigen ligase family protein [Desulfovibrionales bacterium]